MPIFRSITKGKGNNSSGQARIYIRLSHNHQSRDIVTPYFIDPSLLSEKGHVLPKHPSASKMNAKLNAIVSSYYDRSLDLGDDINSMTGQQLKEYLMSAPAESADLFAYAGEIIKTLTETGHNSLAESYCVTISHMKNATGFDRLAFNQLSIQVIRTLETYLVKKNNSVNSIAVHLRNLRAIINRAIDDGVTGQENYPFRRFHIHTEKAQVNNLSIASLKKLVRVRELIPGEGRFITPLHRTADIFMLSFYLGGINLVDICGLKKSDMINGRIRYRRSKTGRLYDIKVEPEALQIIERYAGEVMLLNFMERKKAPKADRHTQIYTDIKRNANKRLRDLAKKLEIKERLTMYSARYSWATIAAAAGISKDTIAQVLGHGMNTTTDGYINYDTRTVDKAIRKVINALLKD